MRPSSDETISVKSSRGRELIQVCHEQDSDEQIPAAMSL
jgi:hypothetical protein